MEPDGGLIIYLEAAEGEATEMCRNLHGLRLAGFFDGARAVLLGRTGAPDSSTLTQSAAALDTLGSLGVPIIKDVEFGQVPPQLTLVNGARGHLLFNDERQYLVQTVT